jgi:CRISPR-associated nuclease/helicase Cas3-like protein
VVSSALHRVGQFWRHASAQVSASESSAAERILGPDLAALFARLPVNDRRHGLDVLETVTRLEAQPSQLLQQAALLHDVGKSGVEFSVIDRSLTVFLDAVSASLLAALIRARPGFARRHAAYKDHARIGADRLRAVGAMELAAIVAEHHAEHPVSDVTRRLQRADRRN